MTSIFLSHSNQDKEIARRLAIDLSMSGIKTWYDEWEIQVGHSISQRIETGLIDAEFVVVLLSKHSVASGWVQKEWRSRIGDEANSKGIIILPVMVDNCDTPPLLRDKRYADLRTDYLSGLRDLIDSIRAHAAVGKPVTAGACIESGQIIFERIEPEIAFLRGLINTIESGCFERSEGKLRLHVHIVPSHNDIKDLGDKIGINRMILESSDFAISTNQDSPTIFRAHRRFTLPKGERITNIGSGKRTPLPTAVNVLTDTTVAAVTKGGIITGNFEQSVTYSSGVQIPNVHAFGTFAAIVAQ